jgi:hypothetical protein
MNQLCSDVALALLMGLPQRSLAAPADLPEPPTPTCSGDPSDSSDPAAPLDLSDLLGLSGLPDLDGLLDGAQRFGRSDLAGASASRPVSTAPTGKIGDAVDGAGDSGHQSGTPGSMCTGGDMSGGDVCPAPRQESASRACHIGDGAGGNASADNGRTGGDRLGCDRTGGGSECTRGSGDEGEDGSGGIVWPAEVMQKIMDRVAAQVGKVNLVIPIATWLGLADVPAEVPGFGPILAAIARDLADNASKARWCYTLTDQDGQPLHYGEIGYRPPGRLRRQVEAFNPTCTHPGCDRPAERCDLDHTVPYDQGGLTCEHNLHPTCRRHHRVKQAPGWELIQINSGVYLYLTPTGQPILVGQGQNPAMN